MIKLGSKVKDKVTGFSGIATARHEYLNGCVRYSVSAAVDKDGKMPADEYVDQHQLEVIGKGVVVAKSDTGGPPRRNPPKF